MTPLRRVPLVRLALVGSLLLGGCLESTGPSASPGEIDGWVTQVNRGPGTTRARVTAGSRPVTSTSHGHIVDVSRAIIHVSFVDGAFEPGTVADVREGAALRATVAPGAMETAMQAYRATEVWVTYPPES